MAVIKRVRLVDDIPVSLETMFIPEAFLPRPDLLDGSLYAHWLAQELSRMCRNMLSLSVTRPRRRQNCFLFRRQPH